MTRIDHRADNEELVERDVKKGLINDQIMRIVLSGSPEEINQLVYKSGTQEILKRLCVVMRYLYKEIKK